MEWVCAMTVGLCIFMPSMHVNGSKVDVEIAYPSNLNERAILTVDCVSGTHTVGTLGPTPFQENSIADRLCDNFVGRKS